MRLGFVIVVIRGPLKLEEGVSTELRVPHVVRRQRDVTHVSPPHVKGPVLCPADPEAVRMQPPEPLAVAGGSPAWPPTSEVMVLEFGGVSKLYCTSTGELVTLPGQAPDYHICRNLNGDATVVSDVADMVKPVLELLKARTWSAWMQTRGGRRWRR